MNVSLSGGLAIEFAEEAALVQAATRLRGSGFVGLDAHTPYPVEALDTLMPKPMTALPLLVFFGGAAGLAGGFLMQWYGAAIGYPINIGGRPFASWPAFIPIAFEISVLGAVLAGFVGFFALAGLPRPYQPLAALPRFERVTQDRFFLFIDKSDPLFDPHRITAAVEEFAPCAISLW
ncbi:MAG TPA: DUF3341 domain-containing protein [Stellaceae bacterium]|jgi:hypothetical protein|nr:DUF3341 domain-containing protein [Stellaceae bacterium]